MTKWAISYLILLVELRYVLLTNSKWPVAVNLMMLDLTSDLKVKVIFQNGLKLT